MADSNSTRPDPSRNPIPIVVQANCHGAVRVVADHASGLICLEVVAEPSVRLLFAPEAGWWLSLGIARATRELLERRP